jgi:hypothetical protein
MMVKILILFNFFKQGNLFILLQKLKPQKIALFNQKRA